MNEELTKQLSIEVLIFLRVLSRPLSFSYTDAMRQPATPTEGLSRLCGSSGVVACRVLRGTSMCLMALVKPLRI